MIDLSYQKKHESEGYEPEEIAVSVIAITLWIGIAIAFMVAL